MVCVVLRDRTIYEDMRESSINLRWSGLYPDIDSEVHRHTQIPRKIRVLAPETKLLEKGSRPLTSVHSRSQERMKLNPSSWNGV